MHKAIQARHAPLIPVALDSVEFPNVIEELQDRQIDEPGRVFYAKMQVAVEDSGPAPEIIV
jgi:hypothetical protein